jgi:four helix bundle protein
MNKITNNNNYDLEDRTLEFSKRIIRLVKKLPQNTVNFKLTDQLVRSGTSVGANYREANDAISKKDFLHRMRISRKEARETTYWLELLVETNLEFKKEIDLLLEECKELRNILSAILTKSEMK